MTNIDDIVSNEQWAKLFDLISNDKSLISKLSPYDISWKRFFYGLVENGKEKSIAPFGDIADLINIVSVCKDNGMTGETLPQATAFQDKNSIESLLSKGNKIDEEDFGERTALMVAATLNDIELIKFLVQQGANVSQYDQDNFEAVDFTSSNEIINLLQSLGGKTKNQRNADYNEYCDAREYLNDIKEINLEFIKGSEVGNIVQMETALLKSPLKLMTLNFSYPINSWTALHYAVKNIDKKIIDYLIGQGIDTSKRNIQGLTAEEMAKKLGHNNLFNDSKINF